MKKNIGFIFVSIIFIPVFILMVFAQETKISSPFPGAVLKLIANNGGRVDWYKGAEHELIAFDSIIDQKTKNTELFVINPDGSAKQCVTCDSAVPKGFVGQPAWYPDGEHIVLQAENNNSRHTLYNHLSWGINQDLWIIKKDGTGAERIFTSPLNHAALHPHFSKDGKMIIFSERIPTGKPLPGKLAKLTPGGENPWDGWRIHIADFDINKHGEEMLSNHRILFGGSSISDESADNAENSSEDLKDESSKLARRKPVLELIKKAKEKRLRQLSKARNSGGFYETHDFTDDGKIVFSHTDNGAAFVDDIYTANIDGSGIRKLINSPLTWDEHGSFSASGRSLAFMSSRAYPAWSSKHSKASALRTELFLKNASGVHQLTAMNKELSSGGQYVVSDFDWDREGKRIVFEVANFDSASSPQIWMIEFSEAQ